MKSILVGIDGSVLFRYREVRIAACMPVIGWRGNPIA